MECLPRYCTCKRRCTNNDTDGAQQAINMLDQASNQVSPHVRNWTRRCKA